MAQIELNDKELSALESIDIVPSTSFIDLDALSKLSPENRAKIITMLEQTQAGGALLWILKQASTATTTVTASTQGEMERLRAENAALKARKPETQAPNDVVAAWVKALDAVKNALEPSWKLPAEYLSAWRQMKAQIPGMEVWWLSEIGDGLNQSRQYNKDLIQYLINEASKPDLNLTFNSWPFSGRPGIYLSFVDDKFATVAEKQKAIVNALNNLENLWKNQWVDASGMGLWHFIWDIKLYGMVQNSQRVRWSGLVWVRQ
jgi:hypothetical protein